MNDGPTLADVTERQREEHELETLVEVLGDDQAQRAAERHVLPELVFMAQRNAA